MNQINLLSQIGPTNPVGVILNKMSLLLGTLLIAFAVANAAGQAVPTGTYAGALKPGDIVRTDSGDAIQGGFILKVDPQTGQETVISHGGYLGFFGFPNSVAIDRNGQIIVANEACLLRIDPDTGGQTMMRDTRGAPGSFWSVAMDSKGDILVAAESAILRIDSLSGQMSIVSSGGNLTTALSVAVDQQNGDIFVTNTRYVANVGWVGQIIRVNSRNGHQTVVADGGFLTFLLGITAHGNDIYVTGLQSHDENFGIGQVTHVDVRTGNQTVVAQGGNLVRPVGIAVDQNGQLIVADPYTVNPASQGSFDGGIIQIDPATGEQTLLDRGSGSVVNPCGVAIVPTVGSKQAPKIGK